MKILKKQFIFIFFLFIAAAGFSQTKTMRFITVDKYDNKPISGAFVRPNLFGDSIFSNNRGVLRLKLASNYFDTVCVIAKNYYPFTIKIERGMAYKVKFIPMTSRSYRIDTLIKPKINQVKKDNFKIVDGYVSNANLKEPIGKVAVCIDSAKVITYSNASGYYYAEIPKSVDSLTLIYPGFQTKKVPAYTQTFHAVLRPDSLSNKEIFKSQNKNSLSLSILELFQGGIAIRYERFLKSNHSIGLLATVYFFNQNSATFSRLEEDKSMFGITGEKFDGIKLSPFYRYYAFRNHRNSGFVEAKLPFGYFSFPSLTYKYHSGYTSYYTVPGPFNFWSVGGGIAWGNTFTNKHFVFTISEGIQIFNMKAPKNYIFQPDPNYSYNMDLVSNWWYFRGAGAIIDLKLSIGWVF